MRDRRLFANEEPELLPPHASASPTLSARSAPPPAARARHVRLGNTLGLQNTEPPLSELAAGDFDGDGIDDVFVGSRATWWFSSGGRTEWRLLNRMPEHASALRFGDFDGDGRADVLALHGRDIDVSWGGISPWQTINTVAADISDLAVGDFNGDQVSDLFLATGQQWFIALGAAAPWQAFGASSIGRRICGPTADERRQSIHPMQ